MNRRGFLAALVAGAVLDPERLLWVPGKITYSIPRPLPTAVADADFFHLGDVIAFGGDPEHYIVTRVGPSLSDIRFNVLPPIKGMDLPHTGLYHSELATAQWQRLYRRLR